MRPRMLTINGETRSISEWSCQPGAANHSTISWRLKHFGWPADRAVFEPSQKPLRPETIRVRVDKGNARIKRRPVAICAVPREVPAFVPCLGSYRAYPLDALELLRRMA